MTGYSTNTPLWLAKDYFWTTTSYTMEEILHKYLWTRATGISFGPPVHKSMPELIAWLEDEIEEVLEARASRSANAYFHTLAELGDAYGVLIFLFLHKEREAEIYKPNVQACLDKLAFITKSIEYTYGPKTTVHFKGVAKNKHNCLVHAASLGLVLSDNAPGTKDALGHRL